MRRSLLTPLACAALLAPLPARALLGDKFPFVQDGPVIVGLTSTDAWVTWYTAHHQGTGTTCSLDGSDNTTLPTLTLSLNGAVLNQFLDASCAREHKVRLTGLSPGTKYTFTLDKPWDKQGGATAAGSFTTAPAPGSRAGFKFVVYGDTRNRFIGQGGDTKADHQALVAAIQANEGDAAFLLHTGDLALNISVISGDDNGYTEFFSVERGLLANKPIFVVLGNHETMGTGFFDSLLDPARYNGSAHPYYSSLDWGPVHVALVDAFEGPHNLATGNAPAVSGAQVQWLTEDLRHAQATGQLSFVGVHQGAYSHAMTSTGHGGLAEVAANVVPLMLQYGVLGSFAGHDHYYQRGHEGCIDYLVVGGGGATMYDPDPAAAGVLAAQKKTSYVAVTVTADGKATAVAKDPSGAALDTFTFTAPPTSCLADGGAPPLPDAGNDAGADAGTGPGADGGSDAGNGGPTGSTGCASTGPVALQLGLFFGALALVRRRRAQR